MRHGVLLECSRLLIESWWTVLKDNGIEIELITSHKHNSLPERDGVHYRSGRIRLKEVSVDIIACPGPFPPTQSPLSGKHLLFISFRESSRRDAETAQMAIDVLLKNGACKLERKAK